MLKGTTLGLDGTTLEANAALRSIVRRDTGESYQEFLTKLAKASGIGTPTRADLARLDRKRKKKGSNDDWTHPHDPDAKITKMKDGRTHLAHKAEHAVDLETGAIVAVTVQDANDGDTTTMQETLITAATHLEEVLPHGDTLCASSSPIRGFTAMTGSSTCAPWGSGPSSPSPTGADGTGARSRRPGRPSMPIVVGSADAAACGCCGGAASTSNGRLRIPTTLGACGARICGDTRIS